MILTSATPSATRQKNWATTTDLTHGQAVAIGMVAAIRLSALLGNEDLTAPLIDLLKHIGLPTELNYDREAIFHALLSDKKKFGATINFILVREARSSRKSRLSMQKSCTNTF